MKNPHFRIPSVILVFTLISHFSVVHAQTPAQCSAEASWVNNPQMQATIGGGEAFCAFHQFAWQNFLALMNGNNFLTLMPTMNVFVASGQPSPWTGQPAPLVLGDIDKEAGNDDTLVAQNKQTVQYDIRLNQTYYNYIASNSLYTTTGFAQVCTGINPPVENQDPKSPLGSLEIKSAWLPMACNASSNQYVCSTDGKYALVGFHLVQKISDHQEWIWASFEHVANAPDCANLGAKPPSGFPSWNFFNGQYSGSTCTPACNQYIDTTTPANVCRTTPIAQDGTAATGGGPLVASINGSVQGLITNPQLLALKNYVLVGTLWLKPGLKALPPTNSTNPPAGQQFIGSTQLANTTMETYLQSINCYQCHSPGTVNLTYNAPGVSFADAQSSQADFSHIFRVIQGPQITSGPCASSSKTKSKAKRKK